MAKICLALGFESLNKNFILLNTPQQSCGVRSRRLTIANFFGVLISLLFC